VFQEFSIKGVFMLVTIWGTGKRLKQSACARRRCLTGQSDFLSCFYPQVKWLRTRRSSIPATEKEQPDNQFLLS